MTAPSHGSDDDDRRDDTPDERDWGAEATVEARSTDRVVTFSDAVVAIAITLLALDLPIPVGHDLTNGDYWDKLTGNWDAYLAFVVSFLVIYNHWSTHRQIFRYVCKLSNRVSQLNMLWLLLMILVPYATKLVTGGGQLGVRFAFYAGIQIIATACALAMSREVRVAHLLRPDAPPSARHVDPVPYLSMIVVYLASIPVAFLAGSWAFALWALSPAVGRFLRRTHAADRFAADDDSV